MFGPFGHFFYIYTFCTYMLSVNNELLLTCYPLNNEFIYILYIFGNFILDLNTLDGHVLLQY